MGFLRTCKALKNPYFISLSHLTCQRCLFLWIKAVWMAETVYRDTISIMKPKSAAIEDSAAFDFEAAFQEYWWRVYRVLFRIVGQQDEAEDLAIETFWRLYRHPPRRVDNLGGWLYRVAVNLGFNALRTQQRRQHYEVEAGQQTWQESLASNPAAEAERNLARDQVRRIRGRMKPREAQLCILKHSRCSYAEIAAALGIAPGSVGTLLTRAEQAFEQLYRKEEEAEDAS